jgi:hypothetical protein
MGGNFDGFHCWIATDDKETRLIFVVVDKETLHTTYQAPDIARVFISKIVRPHGVPKRIISNGGSIFTG